MKQIKKRNEKFETINKEYVFVAICVLVFFIAFINRLFYGVETSDEAFYCVTGYRFIKGNIPFGDMWEATSTNGFIMAPFLLLRSLFVDDGEGILLYLRICFLVLNCIVAYSVYKYANISIKKKYSFLVALLYVFNAPFQMYNFSYNNMANTFVTLTICLMLLGRYKNKWWIFYLMGIAASFAMLAYPTTAFFCIILAIILLIIGRLNQGFHNCISYVMGGITVAIPVIAYISFHVGFYNMLSSISYVLLSDSAHELTLNHIISSLFIALKYIISPLIDNGWGFCVYWVLVVGLSLFERTKVYAKRLALCYPCLCCYYAIQGGSNNTIVIRFIHMTALIAPISILFTSHKLEKAKKCTLEWGTGILLYFIVSFSTGGGSGQAINALIFAVIVGMKLLTEALDEYKVIKFRKIGIYFFLLTAIGSEILLFYRGMYRDSNYSELTAKVEEGVYRGVHTTPERKKHIEDLGNLLKQLEDKEETVLMLYHSCYAFLMVDMIPKIPSAWGCYDYEIYGYDNQSMFMKYFENEKNIPENIFIIDIPAEFDYGRQNVEYYIPYYEKLNEYVYMHYNLIGTYNQGESGIVTKYEVDYSTF